MHRSAFSRNLVWAARGSIQPLLMAHHVAMIAWIHVCATLAWIRRAAEAVPGTALRQRSASHGEAHCEYQDCLHRSRSFHFPVLVRPTQPNARGSCVRRSTQRAATGLHERCRPPAEVRKVLKVLIRPGDRAAPFSFVLISTRQRHPQNVVICRIRARCKNGCPRACDLTF
jgi:hypothetical protein